MKSKNITIKFCNCRSLRINKQFSSPRCTERLCKFPADIISSFPLAVKITNEDSISSGMPLLGKKSYKPSPLPKDLKSEEEVFVIKETNEVFRSYEYPFVFLESGLYSVTRAIFALASGGCCADHCFFRLIIDVISDTPLKV